MWLVKPLRMLLLNQGVSGTSRSVELVWMNEV